MLSKNTQHNEQFAVVDTKHGLRRNPSKCSTFIKATLINVRINHRHLLSGDRVKDIVHAALVAEECSLNRDELSLLIADRAIYRGVLEKLALPIPNPPARWTDPFEELMEQAQSSMSMQKAMKIIRDTVKQVRDKAIALGNEI